MPILHDLTPRLCLCKRLLPWSHLARLQPWLWDAAIIIYCLSEMRIVALKAGWLYFIGNRDTVPPGRLIAWTGLCWWSCGLCLCAWLGFQKWASWVKKKHILRCQSFCLSQSHAFIGAKSNNVWCHTSPVLLHKYLLIFFSSRKGERVNVINSLGAWKDSTRNTVCHLHPLISTLVS